MTASLQRLFGSSTVLMNFGLSNGKDHLTTTDGGGGVTHKPDGGNNSSLSQQIGNNFNGATGPAKNFIGWLQNKWIPQQTSQGELTELCI